MKKYIVTERKQFNDSAETTNYDVYQADFLPHK